MISVDTKKKELVGNYTDKGTEYRPEGQPRRTEVHDFEDKDLGKVVPYGVYDLADNSGWVSLGVTSDTAEFAVNAIRSWFDKKGRTLYPAASRLMITADCGGSNGARVRLWKRKLQDLADQTGLTISVCHFPPGTSKWNKIGWAAFPQRRGPGHRGRHRRPGPQPNARPWMPELRPRRLINSGEWGLLRLVFLRATRCRRRLTKAFSPG